MKAFKLFLSRRRLFAGLLVWLALQIIPCHGQVTVDQIASGLVDFYPLDSVTGVTTPDIIGRRDMFLYGMTSNNIVSANHPGIGGGSNCLNFNQSGGPTVIYYQSTGQNPLDGSGDFLPFINQRGATMNFWVKSSVPAYQDLRVMAECADNGDNNPFFSLSDQTPDKLGLGYFLRLNSPTTDTNGMTVNQFNDGTYQTPAFYYVSCTTSSSTSNTIFDNNWHMFTMEIESNGDVHVFVDGKYDPGDQTNCKPLDREGNPAFASPLDVTNTYYVTNIYPFSTPPTNNPPPSGYVHWMVPGLNVAGAFTTFGGYNRNGNISGGPVCQMSDIGFWNRVLSTNEIQFLMTNGISDCIVIDCSQCHPSITSFSASPSMVHPGESVALQWHIQAITSTPIVSLLLSPAIGEVTNVTDYVTGNGATNQPVFTNTTFTLSLTNLNNCGYTEGQFSRYSSVIVVPLAFSGMSYLISDPGNAGNPSFTMTWNSITNHTYTVQRKLSLKDPTWTTLNSGLPSGGNTTSYTDDSLGSGSAAFYRIVFP